MDVQESEEESNFSQAREAVEIIQLQHPLVYDQYDLRAMAMEGTLKNLKLPVLQRVWEVLGTRYTSPTRRQKGSILGISGGQMHLPEVTFNNCQGFSSYVCSKHLLMGRETVIFFCREGEGEEGSFGRKKISAVTKG